MTLMCIAEKLWLCPSLLASILCKHTSILSQGDRLKCSYFLFYFGFFFLFSLFVSNSSTLNRNERERESEGETFPCIEICLVRKPMTPTGYPSFFKKYIFRCRWFLIHRQNTVHGILLLFIHRYKHVTKINGVKYKERNLVYLYMYFSIYV